jgi:hypothetical protein
VSWPVAGTLAGDRPSRGRVRVSEQEKAIRTLRTSSFVALLACAILTGCAGSKTGSTGSGSTRGLTVTPAPLAHKVPVTENAKVATAACRRAVTRSATLPAQTKDELAAVCDKVSGVISQDLRLIGIVCHEVANSSTTRDASTRLRAYSACLAEGKRRD